MFGDVPEIRNLLLTRIELGAAGFPGLVERGIARPLHRVVQLPQVLEARRIPDRQPGVPGRALARTVVHDRDPRAHGVH